MSQKNAKFLTEHDYRTMNKSIQVVHYTEHQ